MPDKQVRSKGHLIVPAVRSVVPPPPAIPTRKDGLESIRKLQPLPMVVTKLLQLLQRKDVGLKEVSDSIGSDPAFSAEVLMMANSAMIGAVTEVRSIWQALAMVGLDRVKGLALTVGMRGFMGKSANTPVLRKAWRHTLATAVLAEEIATKIYIDSAEAYTAGLLHDIGRIALISTSPQKYADLLETIPGNPMRLIDAERIAYGIDHREAGLELVRKWKLPPLFEKVIARHKATDPELCVFDCPALIALCCGLGHSMGLGILPQVEDVDWQSECEMMTRVMPETDRKRLDFHWNELQLLVASKVNLMDSEAFH